MPGLRVSVAIPIYNEVQVLPELLRRVAAVLDGVPAGPHEIVLVDDGSRDGSREALLKAAASEPRLVVVALSRNFGHQAALSAALDHAGGDAVILMDGDLQDPPEAIPDFVRTHLEGYDVVYAQRVRRKEGWLLRLCYATFYRMLARLSNVQLPVDAGDFGLMSRRVVDQLRNAPERHRYLRGLRAWAGYRQIGIAVERSARAAGESKYSLAKLVALACDGFFSFSVAPLRAAALLGVSAIVLSSLFALYSIVAKFLLHQSPQGFTALILVMVFLSGTNLLFLGLLGEYLGRVYEEVKRRPLYVVDQVVRGTARDSGAPPAEVVAELFR
ncbi:MAG TPA: glycosyltransferase family 2 protein [Gemmataceae bacterium]|nr:glycosyltransferase family 2 protein [Gemmataceae bacterium]